MDTQMDEAEEENVVINTQESTITAVELASQDEEPDRKRKSLPEMKVQDEAKMDENKTMQPKEDQQVRRQSERLGKNIHLTTQERNEIMAQKRCLEGNSTHAVSFSELSNNDMCSIAKNMGVVISEDDFDTFDVVKELELARANLYEKQHINKQTDQNDETVDNDDHEETLIIEWHQDESSESEDFIKSLLGKRKKISKVETRKLKSPQEGKSRTKKILACKSWVQGVSRYA
jgi:hypothetical protein